MTAVDAVTPPRLVGHRVSAADVDFLVTLYGDPRVAATLWPSPHGGPRTAEQVRAILERLTGGWAEKAFGPWVFALDDGTPIGIGGLNDTVVDGRSEIEVLYAIASSHWGCGYATELATMAVETARTVLGIDQLVCFTLTTNRASQVVMERAGFRFVGHIERVGLPQVLYRIP